MCRFCILENFINVASEADTVTFRLCKFLKIMREKDIGHIIRRRGSNYFLLHWCLIEFMYLWLCWVFDAERGFSLVAGSRGYPPIAVHRFLIAVAFLLAEHGFWGCPGFSSCSYWALEYRLRSRGEQA